MTTPRTTARRLSRLGVVAASALALAGCAGNGDAGASSTSSPAGVISSGAAPASTGPTSGSATPSGSSRALSLDMPAALDAEHVKAVKQAVLLAAGPGAEVGLSKASPPERQTELRRAAEDIEQTAAAGASPAPSWSPEQRTCLDATRGALERSADADAAWVDFIVQPTTAATVGGASTASPVPSMTASPKAEVTPMGVRVESFPDEAAARADMEQARTAAVACAGADLPGTGVRELEDVAWEGGTAYTARPVGSVYSHVMAVQDGSRIISVSQGTTEGDAPADAERRAASIVRNVKAALDGT